MGCVLCIGVYKFIHIFSMEQQKVNESFSLGKLYIQVLESAVYVMETALGVLIALHAYNAV